MHKSLLMLTQAGW